MIFKKIETRTARAGVIGLGYVGLPPCGCDREGGIPSDRHRYLFRKIERLKQGISDVPDVTNAVLAPLIASDQIQVTRIFLCYANWTQ